MPNHKIIKELYQNYTVKKNKTNKIKNNKDPRKSKRPKYKGNNVINHKYSQRNIRIAQINVDRLIKAKLEILSKMFNSSGVYE